MTLNDTIQHYIKDVQRLAAFSNGDDGGNPAGVLITDTMLTDHEMLAIAAQVNYSETAFATPISDDQKHWRIRYFSPKIEVAFCGHATIALTAVLSQHTGHDEFSLTLNDAVITVQAEATKPLAKSSIKSPQTWSKALPRPLQDQFCALFGLEQNQLSQDIPPALIHGGASHILLPLNDRQTLSQMQYDFDDGAALMKSHDITTVMLVYAETPKLFHVRNAFAVGGVIEDPATGAAAAALAGYLRDIDWPCDQQFTIRQGDDMGMPSMIDVSFDSVPGSPVSVSGLVRPIEV